MPCYTWHVTTHCMSHIACYTMPVHVTSQHIHLMLFCFKYLVLRFVSWVLWQSQVMWSLSGHVIPLDETSADNMVDFWTALVCLLITCTHVLIPNISFFDLFCECFDRVGSSDPSSYNLRWHRGRSWSHACVFGGLWCCTTESLLTRVENLWRVLTCVDNVLYIGASV